jgi:hypothetical protein
MGRCGAEPNELVRKWFRPLKLLGLKTQVAECQACFKWRRAQTPVDDEHISYQNARNTRSLLGLETDLRGLLFKRL